MTVYAISLYQVANNLIKTEVLPLRTNPVLLERRGTSGKTKLQKLLKAFL